MADTKALGAEIGNELAQSREQGSEKVQEARLLIDAIIARDPKAKLPKILNNPKVQDWQRETGVTDSQLKAALTRARADRRQKVDDKAIKLPRRRRKGGATIVAKDEEKGAAQFDKGSSGVVPNRDLSFL